MPTYDYQCRSCGAVTEVIHSMLEDGPSVCERCGGVLRRVLYPTGIIFKGSGFYRTDSRASATDAPKGGDGASAGTATAKSDEGGSATPKGSTATDSAGTSGTTTKGGSAAD